MSLDAIASMTSISGGPSRVLTADPGLPCDPPIDVSFVPAVPVGPVSVEVGRDVSDLVIVETFLSGIVDVGVGWLPVVWQAGSLASGALRLRGAYRGGITVR